MKCEEGNDINVADCRVVAMFITLFPIMPLELHTIEKIDIREFAIIYCSL